MVVRDTLLSTARLAQWFPAPRGPANPCHMRPGLVQNSASKDPRNHWPNVTRETNEDLQARIEELEKADRAKDQFLALLSHELRNHIHAIRTNAWLIKARAKDAELARPTDAIDRQVVKLSKLVEDLLDVIRVAQKSQLAFEDVTVQQVVSGAV